MTLKRYSKISRYGPLPGGTPLQRRKPLSQGSKPLARGKPLAARSAKTARIYVTRRQIVAELFAEPSICEVPWCTNVATDPHEPLTRARGGDILDPANIRKVCNPHNVMFASDEQPWMYELGFLVHSWEAAS